MHGGAPRAGDNYHLTVTLVDAAGKHIPDARVAAAVSDLGMAGKRRKLEPMRINDTASYGNYFVIKGAGPHRIVVTVTLPGAAKPIEVSFDHKLR